MKKAVIFGSGGFIGGHLVSRLKKEDYWVRGVDIEFQKYNPCRPDEFIQGDLRDINVVRNVLDKNIDEVYQLAADMGGAGYIFSGENDFDIMHNSSLINLNVCQVCLEKGIKKIFYSSSACIYPSYNQLDPQNPKCSEKDAYPADPDSEYGWEKLFSERLYFTLMKNKGIDVKIARFHNIFGPYGTYNNGKEKAPAALCRKVIQSKGEIEVWGDGLQTRSFLFIDECIEGVRRLMKSNFHGPVNIGSEEMVTINQLARKIIKFSEKDIKIKNIPSNNLGVRGRNSDNKLLKEKINWEPKMSLEEGLLKTYNWIEKELRPSYSGSPNF